MRLTSIVRKRDSLRGNNNNSCTVAYATVLTSYYEALERDELEFKSDELETYLLPMITHEPFLHPPTDSK